MTNAAWVEPRDVTLRAPSLEQKFTWKNLLGQKIESAKRQQELISADNVV